MKFHMTPGSCSTGIHILLETLELPFEVYMVNLMAGDQFRPEYLAVNPNATIPTLVRDDGELKAFQGACPHQDDPLCSTFNGRIVTCQLHNWVFDGHTDKCLSPAGCELKQHPLRVEDGMVQVDLEQ